MAESLWLISRILTVDSDDFCLFLGILLEERLFGIPFSAIFADDAQAFSFEKTCLL